MPMNNNYMMSSGHCVSGSFPLDDVGTNSVLDTKNSPLALLAQTCSAIGADTPNPKLLANIEKSTKSSHKSSTDCRDKSSPVGSQSSSVSTGSTEHQQVKSSFKPYESNNNRYDLLDNGGSAGSIVNQSSIRVKTPKSNTATQRCDSNQSATSQRDSPAMMNATPGTTTTQATSANTAARKTPSTLSSASSTGSSVASIHQNADQPNPSPHRASSKESFGGGGNNNTSVSPAQSSPVSKSVSEAQYMKALHAASMQPQVSTAGGQAYYSGYPPGLGYPMDLMTASALMSPHHPMFKAAAMSPYLNYARLKGIDPSSMMPPVCRDPYCTGCPSSPHFLNKAAGQPCPAGCPHCESPSAPKSAAAAAYAHAQLAALAAASQLPYVCSWIAGDAAYCGKRFGTSDELFQHLRTHTASMPESMLAAAAAGGFPPNHPLFQRTYPTPPLSPLSATGRYHPYSKPSMLPPSALGPPPSLAGMPMPPHPSLAQYFSPYSLYGNPRLGSSHP
ncbi:zinc finger protein Elbow isoform X2 [Episyrphus balteatus]|nr:zinc finger protein Elbow isoform X2 [Episyrphus balteatus]